MIKIERTKFLEQFQKAAGAVIAKSPKEALTCVLVESDGESIHMKATDTEVHFQTSIPYVGIMKESALVPASRMVSLLREMTGKDLELTFEKQLQIKCGQTAVKLGILDAADFPPVPGFDAISFYRMKSVEFLKALNRTAFAAGTASRYALAGVHFDNSDPETLVIEATDSSRASRTSHKVEKINTPEVLENGVVLTSKAIKLMLAAIDEAGDVDISLGKNTVSIRSGSLSITCQPLQGRFPNLGAVLARHQNKISVPAGQLMTLIRQVRVLETKESMSVDFRLRKGVLIADHKSEQVGEIESEMVISYDGPDFDVAFTGGYLADILKVIDAGTSIEFSWIDADSILMIDFENCRYAIMPISRD